MTGILIRAIIMLNVNCTIGLKSKGKILFSFILNQLYPDFRLFVRQKEMAYYYKAFSNTASKR